MASHICVRNKFLSGANIHEKEPYGKVLLSTVMGSRTKAAQSLIYLFLLC